MQLEGKKLWQEDLKNNITSIDTLFEMGYIKKEEYAELSKITEKYPLSIPQYYLNLIENKSNSDPIYKMCIASLSEGLAGGKEDTSGEATNTVMEGIQHKYDNTVLLLSTNVCAMYCRHCFRKRLVGQSEEEIIKFADEAVEYVKNHKSVNNILITGGDSFLNSNKIIERYLEKFSEIKHVKFIRFGTRTPVVFPQRIYSDPELLEILKKYSKKKTVYVVTQFNHPKELTKEAIKATDMLREAGVPILNQTVLLKGVNDNEEILSNLIMNLSANGISPYYIFQCRPVKGVKGLFAVPLARSCDIIDNTRSRLSGIGKRFRFIMSHTKGKVEIVGKADKNTLVLKQHQAKEKKDINKIFTVPIDDSSLWLSEDLSKGI
ncbi:KamA family radical SAM protein [bacterium]|nr:KamA family radical SAM protein [bacterium]